MNIHEYQAKQLLAQYGVAVPLEIPAKSLAEVRAGGGKNRRRRQRQAWSSNRRSTPADAARARSKPVFRAA